MPVTLPIVQVIIASTRPGRVGPAVAAWAAAKAEALGSFQVEVVDLADAGLPMLDEPNNPRARTYTRPHTHAFSDVIDRADGYIIVMPEYNHGYNAELKNAIDYLYHEWTNKPVGLVTYGGIAGGARAAQAIKPVLAAVKLIALPDDVPIPLVSSFIHDDGQERTFVPNAAIDGGMDHLLGSLETWVSIFRDASSLQAANAS
ncbi:NADPH-dependent FMN reductase [Nocardioides sp. LHG3406-4]|uniref:NADPH-dependent FMN reductase n=1 Tax=Nocardioides sp. LHG3406-4 TaxID=2804575 RepID=UPI003CEDE244